MKRVGEGGRLVPFFKCVCVYFAALGGGGAGEAAEAAPSPLAVCAKCAPVLSLLLIVLLHSAAAPGESGRYARRVALGLALSALGDALLAWPQHFVAGMGAFAAAHGCYLAAFGWRPAARALAAPLYAATAGYLALLRPPGWLAALVPLYGALLATMAWRGAARALALAGQERGETRRRRAAAAGALLFLASDAVLGYSLFGGAVPHRRLCVMAPYYLGQLGIALSALPPPAAAA